MQSSFGGTRHLGDRETVSRSSRTAPVKVASWIALIYVAFHWSGNTEI